MLVVICLQISIFELLNTTRRPVGVSGQDVVICLQISIFELLNTTIQLFMFNSFML